MLKRLVLLVSLLHATPLIAQSLQYEVDLTDTRSKRVKVTLIPQKLGAETVTFQMPAWAPGAYSVTNYGRYVQDLKAYKDQIDAKREKAMNELVAEAQELGLGY